MSSTKPLLPQYGSGQYGASPLEALAIGWYVALLTSEYRLPNSPKLNALLYQLLKKFDDISQCLVSMDMAWDVDVAIGMQLDTLGILVGASREMRQAVVVSSVTPGGAPPGTYTVFPDYAYRILIKMQIAMNNWDGTFPGIYTVWNTVLGSLGYNMLVQDNQDMTMFYTFLNPPTDPLILALIVQGYFDLRPAGVEILGYYTPSVPGAPIFGYDIENDTVKGWDEGVWLIPLVQT